jgi:hypothetical protein
VDDFGVRDICWWMYGGLMGFCFGDDVQAVDVKFVVP